MADYLYDQVGYLAGTGQINWLFDKFSAILVTDDFGFTETDQNASIITVGQIGGAGPVNNRKVSSDGLLQSEQVVINNVPAGTYNVILVANTPTTSLLLAYYEVGITLTETTNIVIRPNGADADPEGIGSWLQL